MSSFSVLVYQKQNDLKFGTNNANRSAVKQICGCWFSLYNGYCNGHENDSRPYFNSNSRFGHSGNEHLSVWTKNPNRENISRNLPYGDENRIFDRNDISSQNKCGGGNAEQQKRREPGSMNSSGNDFYCQEYITDDDCIYDDEM